MKNFATIFLFLFTVTTYGQPIFPDTLASWSMDCIGTFAPCDYPFTEKGYNYYYNGDTIIDNLKYTLVYRRDTWNSYTEYYSVPNAPTCFTDVTIWNSPYNPYLVAGIRTDSTRVYFKNFHPSGLDFIECVILDKDPEPNGEYLLYDFDLEMGDTVAYNYSSASYIDYLIVDNIDSTDGEKVFGFANRDEHWRLGQGSSNGIFGPYQMPPFESGCRLSCFKLGETFLFGGEGRRCDTFIFSGIKEILPTVPAEIFPNPTADWLNIHFEKRPPPAHLLIYDILGNLLKESPIIQRSSTIDLSDLPNGVLLLSIQTKEGIIHRKKIVKNGS